jgi:signal transduction histidine kinase
VHTETTLGMWDRTRIDSVITNLLSNAAKFGRGLPISICARREGDRACLEVSDQGIGIPAHEQARIFRKFERAVPERHYGGFGLGLWIARQAVEAHGGTIQVASAKDEGSTFTVCLPLFPPAGPLAPAT